NLVCVVEHEGSGLLPQVSPSLWEANVNPRELRGAEVDSANLPSHPQGTHPETRQCHKHFLASFPSHYVAHGGRARDCQNNSSGYAGRRIQTNVPHSRHLKEEQLPVCCLRH